MRTSIKDGINKGKKIVPDTRLISEIIHQGGLLQRLHELGVDSDDDLGTSTRKVINGTMLGDVRIIDKKKVIVHNDDLMFSTKKTDLLDDFAPISIEDHPVVIAKYIAAHFKET
jgi:hypothetical protein